MSKKILQAAAGAAGGESVYVEDVFSTYLYEGASTPQTITNGIDLSGEGGMVWIKCRDNAYDNFVFDTERTNKHLHTNRDHQEIYDSSNYIDYNSDGFDVEASSGLIGGPYSFNYASWTFRKQAGFFDVVTYTGDGSTSSKTISHSLGSTPGHIILKKTSASQAWYNMAKDGSNYTAMSLNDSGASFGTTAQSNVADSTTFDVGYLQGWGGFGNDSGATYVAYLFAHDDQSFGDNGDESIIKCGSYTGTGAAGLEVDLGFEPQWLMFKRTDSTSDWSMFDNMRGIVTGGDDARLRAQGADAENTFNYVDLTATGFSLSYGGTDMNASGGTYIYIAIRRPMKTPESGTEVFSPETYTGNGSTQSITGLGFSPDLVIPKWRSNGGGGYSSRPGALYDRLRGATIELSPTGTSAESTQSNGLTSFDQDGFSLGSSSIINSSPDPYISWNFKRATGFMDVICHSGSGYNTNVKHNLGVVPELVISKTRSASGFGTDLDKWYVWSSAVSGSGNNAFGFLNETGTTTNGFFASSPTSTDLYLHGNVAYSGDSLVKYLFATVAGVSKVGSYTGDGTSDSSHVIDCGFSAGARFVMIKRTDSTGDWWVFDTTRGLVAGADTRIALNSTSAEYTGIDDIDPHNSGFIVTNPGGSDLNVNNATYIFLAIA